MQTNTLVIIDSIESHKDGHANVYGAVIAVSISQGFHDMTASLISMGFQVKNLSFTSFH